MGVPRWSLARQEEGDAKPGGSGRLRFVSEPLGAHALEAEYGVGIAGGDTSGFLSRWSAPSAAKGTGPGGGLADGAEPGPS